MRTQTVGTGAFGGFGGFGAVRILLAAARDITARLTLRAVLEKSGYLVDLAASADDAIDRIDTGQYALVLCDPRGDQSGDCERILAAARELEHGPATALLKISPDSGESESSDEVFVEPMDVPQLLTEIAELLAERAYGRATAVA